MSFYVILPSNTAVEGNKTNSFRVRFPRKLEFHSDWSVGLAVFVYPHTWPSLGATGELEFIRVRWNNNILLECQLAPTRPANPQELARRIATSLLESAEQIARRIDSIQQRILEHSAAIWERIERKIEAQKAKIHKAHAMDTNRTKVDGETAAATGLAVEIASTAQVASKVSEPTSVVHTAKEEEKWEIAKEKIFTLEVLQLFMADSADTELLQQCAINRKRLGRLDELLDWAQKLRAISDTHCILKFDGNRQRFHMLLNANSIVEYEWSSQLAYILGFSERVISVKSQSTANSAVAEIASEVEYKLVEAPFMPDLSGGVSTLYVYAPGLIEPVIIGDCLAPLLRVAIVKGKADEIVEEAFVSIQYHKLLTKEINEIQIEIRGASGQLMPFEYGSCILTLHFRKTPYF